MIVATGLWRVNKPPVEGQELIHHYDEVSVDAEMFRGKNVLILGRGESFGSTLSHSQTGN